MRKRLFDVIEKYTEGDRLSHLYDLGMMAMILISLVPLAFKYTTPLFWTIERVAVCVFILDYLLRWGTADLKLKKGMKSFLVYPFTFMAIIDLLSILPVLTVLNEGFRSLRVLRLFTTMRVLRVFKILRYSRNINIIVRVFRKQKDALIVVGWLVVGYIFVTALVVFNMEPRTFNDFFHALYWATISLTTVGYGDVYPMSTTGRFITMLSSVVGVAVIALPSSILTVGYLAEITEEKEEKRDDE